MLYVLCNEALAPGMKKYLDDEIREYEVTNYPTSNSAVNEELLYDFKTFAEWVGENTCIFTEASGNNMKLMQILHRYDVDCKIVHYKFTTFPDGEFKLI